MILKNEDIYCEECDKLKTNLWICLNCKETFCSNCEKKIHRKSRRFLHKRVLANEVFYKSPKDEKFSITFFTKEFYINNFLEDRGRFLEIKERIFQKMVEETKKGNCMIKLEKIICFLKDQKFSLNETDLREILFPLNEQSSFLLTVRSFGQKTKEIYISLRLKIVSLEIVISILKSIFKDKMEPRYILIHSRLKEYHGIEISMTLWKQFIKDIYQTDSQFNINKYSNYLGKLETILSSEEGNILLLPENLIWQYEDMLKITDDDKDYLIYLECMDNFFEKENSEEFEFFYKNPDKWNFSSSLNNSSKTGLLKLMKDKNITKAIPGGKYGCALMLKYFYSKKFENISIGKLNALIKYSFEKQVYIHKKTLIRKNITPNKYTEIERVEMVEEVKKLTLLILETRGINGISLSELPLSLKNTFGKDFNFPDLGFPQLKNFIEILSDKIILVKNDNNHIIAKLKNFVFVPRKNSENLVLSVKKNFPEIQTSYSVQDLKNESKKSIENEIKKKKLKYKRKGINLKDFKTSSFNTANNMISDEDISFTNLMSIEQKKRNLDYDLFEFKNKNLKNFKSPYYIPPDNKLEDTFVFKKILISIIKKQKGVSIDSLEKQIKNKLKKKGIKNYDYRNLSFIKYLQKDFGDFVFFSKNKKVFINNKSSIYKINSHSHINHINKRKNSFANGLSTNSKEFQINHRNSQFYRVSSGNTTPIENKFILFSNDYFPNNSNFNSPQNENNLKNINSVFAHSEQFNNNKSSKKLENFPTLKSNIIPKKNINYQ